MPNDKRKRAQPAKKRKPSKKPEKKTESTPQRRDQPAEPAPSMQPDRPGQEEPRGPRPRTGAGLDRSDEGVIAGRRLAGRRFTG